MAGLIDQQMQPMPGAGVPPEQGAPNAGPAVIPGARAPQGGSFDFSPQAVRAGMQMPPELQEPYQRVVTAGMKVMFDPKSRNQVMALLQQEGPLAQKLGQAIAGLLLMMFEQSNKTMPPQVMIPAGVELLSHAVDLLAKAGQQVSPQEIAAATEIFITTMLKKFNIDPNKLQEGIAQGAGRQQPAAPAEQPAPEAPPQEGAPMPGNETELMQGA
jgi:hypothetical protein